MEHQHHRLLADPPNAAAVFRHGDRDREEHARRLQRLNIYVKVNIKPIRLNHQESKVSSASTKREQSVSTYCVFPNGGARKFHEASSRKAKTNDVKSEE